MVLQMPITSSLNPLQASLPPNPPSSHVIVLHPPFSPVPTPCLQPLLNGVSTPKSCP